VKLTRPSRSSLARLVARTLIAALLLALIPPEVRASIPSPNDRRAHPDLLVSSASHAVLVVAVAKDQACAVVFAAADPHFFGIVWDFENRLTKVTKLDGTVVEHAYDADGNRVQTKTTPSGGPTAFTNFLVDTSGGLSHAVAETDETGALKAYYVRGDDLLAVMRPLVLVPTTPADWQTRFVHADGLGSIRRLTDENGLITDGYSYTAFGELVAHTGTDPQPYAFAGEPYDPNVGFQYHRARWMDPRVGRFTGMDRFAGRRQQPLTLHKYLYAGAAPVDKVDPTGEFETLATLSVSLGMMSTLNAIASIGLGDPGEDEEPKLPKASVEMTFFIRDGVLLVTPVGKGAYMVLAESGKGDCINNPTCANEPFKGPIPPGYYSIDVSKLSEPGLPRVLKRFFWDRLDWGSFKVPIKPAPINPTSRSDFYLHGGILRGSAGCVDIGGGFTGSSTTREVVRDMKGDPDLWVPLKVESSSSLQPPII